MKARLVDVAKEAGVSPKTVSNYLNGYPFMSERTVQRVRDAVAKLNYVPNRSAQSLRTGKMRAIGLAVHDLSTPYFAELAARITEAGEERGYTVLIDQTNADLERERRAAGGLGRQALDGVILSPLKLSAEDVAAATSTMPVVVLGEWAHPAGVPYVGVDNISAARAATDHLLRLGHRRIAAIGTISDVPSGTWGVRLTGYRQALTAAGIAEDPALQPRIRNFKYDQGVRAMEQLLDLPEPPDAIFCFSDLLAIGALSVLNARGISVPDQIAVMGWDDIAEAAYSWPPLTTVRAATEVVARTAVDYLLRQIAGEPIDSPDHYVDFEIVVRQTTRG